MIISPKFLNSIAKSKNITEHSEQTILLENTFFINKSINKQYDIFLSHSYLDKIQILALLDLFHEKGFSVYIDWLEDQQLNRSNVNTQMVYLYCYLMHRFQFAEMFLLTTLQKIGSFLKKAMLLAFCRSKFPQVVTGNSSMLNTFF